MSRSVGSPKGIHIVGAVGGVVLILGSSCLGVVYRAGLWNWLPVFGCLTGACALATATLHHMYLRIGDPDNLAFITMGAFSLVAPAQLTIAWTYVSPGALGFTLWCFLAFWTHMATLVKPRMHGSLFKVLISYPATVGCFAAIAGAPLLPAAWLPKSAAIAVCVVFPYCLGILGVIQSLWPVKRNWDVIKLQAGPGCEPLKTDAPIRVPHNTPSSTSLRIIQLTDMHLGPYMTEERLATICKKAVDYNPDLILLTGDYHTPESDHTEGCLVRALSPLRGFQHCYASLGNHDAESDRVENQVREDLHELGIKLLVDESTVVEVAGKMVSITGHGWPHRIAGVLRNTPAPPQDAVNIHLIHDPGSFQFLPSTEGAIAFAGHTHGGQVGLLSLGLKLTMVGAATGHPDHSYWGHGVNRLWAHRGQGFRSLSCNWVPRLGVPAEFSIIHLCWLKKRDGSEDGVRAHA